MTPMLALLRFATRYVPWLGWQLIVTTLRLGFDVATPGTTQRPRIVKLSLTDLTDLEVTLLTSSITITPGTLVLGVAPAGDGSPPAAYVQSLFGEDGPSVIAELEEMRRRVLLATRGNQPGGGRS